MKKKQPAAAVPSALVAGLLQDGERALFLVRRNVKGEETVELPFVLLQKGGNPVAALAAEFRRQTGIDAQVHEIAFERKHNIGSRKRKAFVPVLVFRLTAKNAAAKTAPEFSGYRWLSPEDLAGCRKARSAAWL